jgi:hypothetical protein
MLVGQQSEAGDVLARTREPCEPEQRQTVDADEELAQSITSV